MEQAETGRSEQAVPGRYPSEYVENIALSDGTPVVIRPIRPDDAPRLQAAFQRLTAESVYLRFLETLKQLPDKQARELSHLDYIQRMALVAETVENGEEAIIGVARYSMVGEARPGLAEIAIVVVDDYQNRGVGSQLLKRIVRYAREHGVKGFLGTIHHTNARIMRFIQRSNLPTRRKVLEPGVWEVCVSLEDGDAAGAC